ncbi:quinol:cytochrome C oxidoreductase [Aureibacter tunicatorum]|uniref:Quinol:cytochrome C oxidoreductase n=1 Tax=Aureibacter tunicatorum TaxID=866807 RepID=A0AAE3XLW1_9BACT|nr:quinol:cytochrome C oxidoreductase [Aureibacter tunicatorum]MDR6238983.1 hypothetical protein [Aureibacter tunicatorum]BDD05091.1 hypothetical protein AUTU_25740 [Aureibacter tunicatorum]
MLEEKFVFTAGAKKKITILAVVGVILAVLGFVMMNSGGHHDAAAHGAAAEGAHHGFSWTKRLFANLWINNVYFVGLSIIGVFFVALQYASQAGWSAPIKRIPEAFGFWLPIGGALMIITFLIGNHDLFHWTHEYLYDPKDPHYDTILVGKRAFLNTPFFLGRMVAYFVLWFGLFWQLRKISLQEDEMGGDQHWFKMRKYSAIFLVIFAVTSSTSAWDWVMSIDPHWFSTLFGWYVFSSWWVSGLAAITLIVVFLKEAGYLKVVNENHLHDLGKFVFGFSVFWAYLWFSQFLLYYYANIPEEIIYYIDRFKNDHYSPYFFLNLFINFFFPFLVLMTRDSKRHFMTIKIACVAILIGHWLDFFLMITPGTLKENGGIGFFEIGITLVYLSGFLFVVLTSLSKAGLIAKNHPMMKESLHHHI